MDLTTIHAAIDQISEQHAHHLSDEQLAVYYQLEDRSPLSALRWLRRCVRTLPRRPKDYTYLPPEERVRPVYTSFCACGNGKLPASKRCQACHLKLARVVICTVAGCGAPTSPRSGLCADHFKVARYEALQRHLERKRRAA